MFGELRRLLYGEVDWVTWGAICALVDHLCDPDSPAYEPGALDYARAGAARWPDALREPQAPSQDRETPPPHLALARAATWYGFEDQARLRRWLPELASITCFGTDMPSALLREPALAGRLDALKQLQIHDAPPADALALLERVNPALEKLELAWVELGEAEVRLLAALPHLPHLRELELGVKEEEGTAAIAALMSSPRLDMLETLRISGSHGALDLAPGLRSWRGQPLRSFGLSLCQRLAPGSIRELAARWGGSLESLELAQVGHDHTELLEVISDGAAFPALRELKLAGFTGEQARPLLDALSRRPLRELTIYAAPLDDALPAALPSLRGSALADTLESLSLGSVSLSARGCEALAAARWPRLKSLSMWGSALGAPGAAALAAPGAFEAVARLSLSGADVQDAGLERLARGLPALRELILDGGGLSDEGVYSLLSSPAASRLRSLDLSDSPGVTELHLLRLLEPSCMPELLSLAVARTTFADTLSAGGAMLEELRLAKPWLQIDHSVARPEDEEELEDDYSEDDLYDLYDGDEE